jgi:hypothetical protein
MKSPMHQRPDEEAGELTERFIAKYARAAAPRATPKVAAARTRATSNAAAAPTRRRAPAK